MPTYLVTGGCGFIGSHLVNRLLSLGNKVIVLDNLSTGKKENLAFECQVYVGDVTDKTIVEELVSTVDGIFHLAAIASVEKSIHDLKESHMTNVGGTVTLIDALIKTGKRVPIIFASSSAVYGNPKETPISENAPLLPLSPYGLDKLHSERHLKLASEIHNIDSTSFRLFNVFGPKQDASSPYSGVIALFSKRLFLGEPLHIFGSGTQQRDFVFVEDVVAYFLAAIEKKREGAHVFNIGTNQGTSILKLAQTLEEVLERKGERVFLGERKGEPKISIGDISKACLYFAFRPKTSLKEGLSLCLKELSKVD